MKRPVYVSFASENLEDKALSIAHKLGLSIANSKFPSLLVTIDKLVLNLENIKPLFADFSARALKRRVAAGKKQGIIKACQPKKGITILDATAGWGRDGALLSHFGARVVLLERNIVMHALLEDALLRAPKKLYLSLHNVDARDYISELVADSYPDVIYIDPMHPERKKKALVKKDMQALQNLLGYSDDVKALIEESLSKVKSKVVVKWPAHSEALLKPDYSINGKTVRFDVYKK